MYDINLISHYISRQKNKMVLNAQDCLAASGNKLNSLGIYVIDL
jgi:hypothetical protein